MVARDVWRPKRYTKQAIRERRFAKLSIPWLVLTIRMERGWTTKEGTKRNLDLVARYLHDHWEDQNCLWRVSSLLNSLHRTDIGDVQKRWITDARIKVDRALNEAIWSQKGVVSKRDPQDKVRSDWNALSRTDLNLVHAYILNKLDQTHGEDEAILWLAGCIGIVYRPQPKVIPPPQPERVYFEGEWFELPPLDTP